MGWVPPMLPYLEQKPIYDRIQQNLAAVSNPANFGIKPYLSILICPSRSATDTLAPLSYVVNAGMTDNYTPVSGTPLDYQANGVFFDHYSTTYPGSKGPRITTDLSYITSHDGTSSTVLFSENVDAQDWIGVTSQTPGTTQYQGDSWWQGIVWKLDSTDAWYPNYPNFLNKDFATLKAADPPINRSDIYCAKPTSAHPGGFIVTMVDNHSFFVSQDIEYRVYAMVMAPWSSQAENIDPKTNMIVPYPTTLVAPTPGAWVDTSGNLVPVTEDDLTK